MDILKPNWKKDIPDDIINLSNQTLTKIYIDKCKKDGTI
jgi:hypothetical protein